MDSDDAAPIVPTGIRAIVGLGNAGQRYQKNRHNVGRWFVELIAQTYQARFIDKPRLLGQVCRIQEAGVCLHLFKPHGFMNDSGRPVNTFQRFFQLPTEQILIAHDEIDFPAAHLRIKYGGGHGGHNGLRSIIQCIGRQFWRLRIGIGRPLNQSIAVSDYVLSNVDAQQQADLSSALENVVQHVPQLVAGEFALLMNRLHHNPPPPRPL